MKVKVVSQHSVYKISSQLVQLGTRDVCAFVRFFRYHSFKKHEASLVLAGILIINVNFRAESIFMPFFGL